MFLSKDSKGMIFSTDLLLVLLLFIVILGIVANIIYSSNEKILNPLEVAELERLSGEVVDNLINNPGTPSHWENFFNFDGVSPGLAIENSGGEAIINTISFKKIKILENNGYDDLITEKMFGGEIKSSITLYPIDSDIDPVFIGDSSLNGNTTLSNSNISNIVVVNRTVKCDFYHDLALVSVFKGNELEKNIIEYNNSINNNNNNSNNNNNNNNLNELSISRNICNHETINNLNHSDNESYKWICKEFKITKKDFEENNYFLFFSNASTNNGNYWIIDDISNISNSENPINNEKISLNNHFTSIFENKSSMIFYLHFKINKNNLNDFNAVLVSIPKDIDENNLNIDYFKEQDCYFIMKTSY